MAVPGSETILLELDSLSSATNHNGGALHFGADGKLYVAVGNNANNANSQTLTNLHGKILRLNSDGTIPTDNPFYGISGDRWEIWNYGLRNPFTFGIQPGTGLIFVDDVGENTWEEINVGSAGVNYGWPTCEGPFLQGTSTPCNNPLYTDPIYWYQHVSGPSARSRAATSTTPTCRSSRPSTSACTSSPTTAPAGSSTSTPPTRSTASTFASGISSPVDVVGGYDGNLYYLARGHQHRLQDHLHGQQLAEHHRGPGESADLRDPPGDVQRERGRCADPDSTSGRRTTWTSRARTWPRTRSHPSRWPTTESSSAARSRTARAAPRAPRRY